MHDLLMEKAIHVCMCQYSTGYVDVKIAGFDHLIPTKYLCGKKQIQSFPRN